MQCIKRGKRERKKKVRAWKPLCYPVNSGTIWKSYQSGHQHSSQSEFSYSKIPIYEAPYWQLWFFQFFKNNIMHRQHSIAWMVVISANTRYGFFFFFSSKIYISSTIGMILWYTHFYRHGSRSIFAKIGTYTIFPEKKIMLTENNRFPRIIYTDWTVLTSSPLSAGA